MIESIPPSKVLGVFGMSIFTRRDDLEKVFSEYGTIEKCEIIMNRQVKLKKEILCLYLIITITPSPSIALFVDW